MLFQLQQEKIDSAEASKFIAQREFAEGTTPEQFRTWVRSIRDKHDLPTGFRWVIHNEESPGFFWMSADACN